MALEKFRASPLPIPGVEYDQQYMLQLIRIIGLYFSQLDSLTPNQAQSYRADQFIGGEFIGDFSGGTVTAESVDTTFLTAQSATTKVIQAQNFQGGSAVMGNVMANNFYGGMFYGDGRFISTPYNQFESRVDQTAAAVDQAYALQLEVTDFQDTIEITGVNNTRITFSEAGIYFITYSLQFKNTTNDGQSIDIWIRYNGTDYANSNTKFHVPARKSTGDPSFVVAVTTIAGDALNDNDYVEIMWRVSDTGVSLEYLPAVTYSAGVTPAIPATPSAIVQAAFISAQFPPAQRVAPLGVIGYSKIGEVTVFTA